MVEMNEAERGKKEELKERIIIIINIDDYIKNTI